jgi:hypothetical protein
MNLFRSEEHVKRWSLFEPASEDLIMPVTDWAQVFGGPMHARRLDADYMYHAQEYLAIYHDALRQRGKETSFWMIPLVRDLEAVRLARYSIVGDYIRFEKPLLHALKDLRTRMVGGLEDGIARRNNYLLWAPPGSGKTYFVQQVAASLQEAVRYIELNLAKVGREGLQAGLEQVANAEGPVLVLIDEVDARADEPWPFEILLPYLDLGPQGLPVVFVLAGSASHGLEEMKRLMAARAKGRDVLSRIPAENEAVIPAMTFGDRVLVVLGQFCRAARENGREIGSVEKLALYYSAVNPRLANKRQLREFAVRAAARVPAHDDRIKYDHLFEAGDPENKRFYMELVPMAAELVNRYIDVEA